MGRKSREKREGRKAEVQQLAEKRLLASEGASRGCLICRGSDGGFTSREHIFPESLGNTKEEHVLPIGVVCDRCNHGVCAQLDAALCDFGPIAMLRTIHRIPSKKGALPTFKFDNGTLTAKADDELVLELDSTRWSKRQTRRPDGLYEWGWTGQRHDATPRRLSLVHRALVKMALEYAWLDLDEEVVLGAEFDHLREIICHVGHRGYLVVPKEATPDDQLSLTYMRLTRNEDATPLLGIEARFWGVVLATDTLFERPPRDVPDDLAAVLTF